MRRIHSYGNRHGPAKKFRLVVAADDAKCGVRPEGPANEQLPQRTAGAQSVAGVDRFVDRVVRAERVAAQIRRVVVVDVGEVQNDPNGVVSNNKATECDNHDFPRGSKLEFPVRQTTIKFCNGRLPNWTTLSKFVGEKRLDPTFLL